LEEITVTETQITALIAGSSGVLGAFFGALGGVVGHLLTKRAERRQERLRLAVQLGTADYQARIDALKSKLLPEGQRALPLALYLDYHARMIIALESGPLTPQAMKQLHEDHTSVKTQLDALPPYMIPPLGGSQG
jgi:hypothetical protein